MLIYQKLLPNILGVNYIYSAITAVASAVVLFLFQNCSTDFGNSHNANALNAKGYHWVLLYGACSAQCGTGTQAASAVCEDVNGNSTSNNLCTTPLPALTPKSCTVQACGTYTWFTTITAGCNPTNGICGSGTQPQTVVCHNSSAQTVPDTWCTTTKPATLATCAGAACPPSPAPNSAFGCNPGIFDHCVITATTNSSNAANVTGTCEGGFAGASPCFASCHLVGAKGAGEQWYVTSDCGHASTTTAY